MKILFTTYWLLQLLLFTINGFGFNLTVTSTNETCSGNGSLSFTPSNTDPNGSIVYVVYKLPDVTIPYASGTSTSVSGLSAGDYRIIARETVGSTTTSQQQDVTITSSYIPLTYTIQSLNQACLTTSTISIVVKTGTAITYAIISGPVTFPSQASNTFSGLAVGIYRIKVTDSCGNSVVQAFTVTLNPAGLTITDPIFTDTPIPSCNFVVANNTIASAPGTVIGYPLHIEYVLHLPDGTVSHIQYVLNSGNPVSQVVSETVPYPNNQDYTYDMIITDACNTTYPGSSFIVNKAISISSIVNTLPCNKYYFTLKTDNYVGSYSLQFTTVPAGFNPAAFNSSYPGLYNQSSVSFGSQTQPVPFGDYTVTVTDMCGKTNTIDIHIINKPPHPDSTGINNGCSTNDGKIVLSLADYIIITAVVTAAPSSYPFTLPHDVSALISSDGSVLTIDPVPLGDYIIQITDNCGDIIPPINVNVPTFIVKEMEIEVLQGCGLNNTSVRLTSNNGTPVTVKITAAPSSYPFPLPHEVSSNIISNGKVYISDLPTGNYTFSILDNCGFTSTKTEMINGYAITSSSFQLVPECGVFNILLHFVDNASSDETFGLQKLLNPDSNIWGNPITGAIYTEGTIPNETNSYLLENNSTNYNLSFNGVFRIVHHFTSYNNGSDIINNVVTSPTKDCIEILSPTLSYNSALAINKIYRIPCSSNGNFDVYLSTIGTNPLHYKIVEKDGVSFVVDNGTSDVFLNLTQGTYKFEIEDSCGNILNRTSDVSDLSSLVTIYPVCDKFNCVSTITGNETFDLSSQSAIILGAQLSSQYTLTYYTSQTDAENNINSISNLVNFNPATNPETIYIRLIFNRFPNCYETGSFNLITGQAPKINLASDYLICDGHPVQLDASLGNLPTTTYSWSNGLNTSNITVSAIGTTTVSVTATNTYGSCNNVPFNCTTSKDIVVTIPDLPQIDHIETADWTDNENSITVVTSHDGIFEYSIDGINFQASAIFSHLTPGLYTVYVRDINGCKTVTEEIWLLNYPKFFTPNGDGYNETWYIKNSENEPDFKVYIFDRYGKLITAITSNTLGWDGKLNGKLLFADDYWFTAYRQDGRILRGHFTLKR